MSGPIDDTLYSPPPITDPTVDRIRTDALDTGFLNKDRHDRLLDLTATLNNAGSQEANAAIAALRDVELIELATSVNSRSVLRWQLRVLDNGLSADEKAQLFTAMARKLDATQLNRVFDAFAGTATVDKVAVHIEDEPSYQDSLMLGTAIADGADPETKLAFIKLRAQRSDPDLTEMTGSRSGLITLAPDRNTTVVAEVLSSLKGEPQFDKAVRYIKTFGSTGLSLPRLVQSAAGVTWEMSYADLSDPGTLRAKPTKLVAIVDAATASDDLSVKCGLVTHAAAEADAIKDIVLGTMPQMRLQVGIVMLRQQLLEAGSNCTLASTDWPAAGE